MTTFCTVLSVILVAFLVASPVLLHAFSIMAFGGKGGHEDDQTDEQKYMKYLERQRKGMPK
jgi:hypothetical protein